MPSILIKPIKDGLGNVTGLGELVAGEVAVVPGPLEFQDGTQQTTAYIPGDGNVTSFVGREGAITPQYADYDAIKIALDPSTITGVDANNVQEGFEQLSNSINALQGGLDFKGLLGFNDADPAAPPAGGATHYYIFKTAGARTVGDAAGVTVAVGDWLAYSRSTSKWVHLAYALRTQDAAGTAYDDTANTYIKGATVQAALDKVELQVNSFDTRLDALDAADYVNTFAGRKGAVIPSDGDYSGVQVTHVPAGPIVTATNVQAAIDQLEAAVDAAAGNTDAVDTHINDKEGAHEASAITYFPVAQPLKGVKALTSTDVQGAITEVASRSIPFFDTNGSSKPIPLV